MHFDGMQLTFYTLFWYHAPFYLEKLKTRIIKYFHLLIFFIKSFICKINLNSLNTFRLIVQK